MQNARPNLALDLDFLPQRHLFQDQQLQPSDLNADIDKIVVAVTEADQDENRWRIDRDSEDGSYSEHESDFNLISATSKPKNNNPSSPQTETQQHQVHHAFSKPKHFQRGLPQTSVPDDIDEQVGEIDWSKQDSNVVKQLIL